MCVDNRLLSEYTDTMSCKYMLTTSHLSCILICTDAEKLLVKNTSVVRLLCYCACMYIYCAWMYPMQGNELVGTQISPSFLTSS